jgi:hypothetical protein
MQGQIKPGKILTQFGPVLSRFLSKNLFASARIIAIHFGVARDSMKMILARELGLKILKAMTTTSTERSSEKVTSRICSRPSPNS